MNKNLIACSLATVALVIAAPAVAQDAATDAQTVRATLLSLIRTLLDTNVITAAKARELVRQAGLDPAVLETPPTWGAPPVAGSAPAAAPPVVRVPYVPEAVKSQLREEIRQEVLATARAERWAVPEALPGWLSRLSFDGDLRVRLQREDFADDNDVPALLDSFYQSLGPTGQPVTRNTTEDRDRLRLRARLGVSAKVSDEVQAGLRLVTSRDGDANDPASANVDAGQFNRRFGLALDLAYIGWTDGRFVASAGRIANPYRTTDLLWSTDLTLDGAALSWRPVFNYDWSGFATVGVHPLREVNNSAFNLASDSVLVGAQAGVEWRSGGAWSGRLGVGVSEFRNRIVVLPCALTNGAPITATPPARALAEAPRNVLLPRSAISSCCRWSFVVTFMKIPSVIARVAERTIAVTLRSRERRHAIEAPAKLPARLRRSLARHRAQRQRAPDDRRWFLSRRSAPQSALRCPRA